MTRARSWVERRPSSASRTTAASADTSRVQLKSLGYKVVPAASATEALAIAADGTPFDLLFTDIVMPGGINGRELAEQMVAARPSLRCYSHRATPTTPGTHQEASPWVRRC